MTHALADPWGGSLLPFWSLPFTSSPWVDHEILNWTDEDQLLAPTERPRSRSDRTPLMCDVSKKRQQEYNVRFVSANWAWLVLMVTSVLALKSAPFTRLYRVFDACATSLRPTERSHWVVFQILCAPPWLHLDTTSASLSYYRRLLQ